jgi:hypothetical protein
MNKSTLFTFTLLVMIQSAQAQITVTPIYEPSWQSTPETSTAQVNIVIQGSAEERALFGATAPKLTIEPSVFENEATACTSWQCASKNESNSAARQIQNLDQYLPALTAVSADDESSTESEPIVVTATKTKLSYADRLMRLIRVGARYGKNQCGKGLRKIFEAAGLFSKSAQANRRRTESTKNWGPYLEDQGFKNMGKNSPLCKVAGTIRVYNGTQIKVRRRTAGDIHGHIEFVGTDGRFHSSRSSSRSRDTQVAPGRRPLIGCYVKKSEVEV